MRIAISGWFLDQPNTGSGQYLRGLLNALPAVMPGDEFLLVTPPGVAGVSVPGLNVEQRTLASPRRRTNLGKVFFEQVGFPRAARAWGADVAHVPYWGSPLSTPVPTVVTVHDLIPLLLPGYQRSPLVRFYTLLVAEAARVATAVITDSLASKRDIVAHLGVPDDRVHAIYLAPGERFRPDPQPGDADVRRRYSLPPRYVLYLAGHDERKNVAGLVEAFHTVVNADADATLVIGGALPEGSRPPLYDPRPLVRALEMEEGVRFIGHVAQGDEPALYRGAACAVFPSRYEGFGLPVLEALACGTPLVTSNVSSLPELAGDAAFTIDPDNLRALAGAIVACLVDDTVAAELCKRGPVQAARFRWADTARETAAVYRRVAMLGAKS
jgi:glycosyltransferase involved in cell wall biosynthesis